QASSGSVTARHPSRRLHCLRAGSRPTARPTYRSCARRWPRRCGPDHAVMNELLVITLGYVIGSVPFAFLVARRHGIDLRRVGSLNVGASNVLRTSGVSDAIFAMALDASKGALAVLVAQRLGADPGGATAAGVASILGHVYPVWLGFRGGK